MQTSLHEKAREIYIDVLKLFYKSRLGHLSSSLSCVDILTALYFDQEISKTRDRVVLSKGHAAGALYTTYVHCGLLPKELLPTFFGRETKLCSLISNVIPEIPLHTGSLGQGFCFATGLAMANKLKKVQKYVYCILGDGELQEGSIWEAATFAENQKLNKLIAILDYNKLQVSDFVDAFSPSALVEDKWKSFGWHTIVADGHDAEKIRDAILKVQTITDKPTIIIAQTLKGHGVKAIENKFNCHALMPKNEDWDTICDELHISKMELENL